MGLAVWGLWEGVKMNDSVGFGRPTQVALFPTFAGAGLGQMKNTAH